MHDSYNAYRGASCSRCRVPEAKAAKMAAMNLHGSRLGCNCAPAIKNPTCLIFLQQARARLARHATLGAVQLCLTYLYPDFEQQSNQVN